MSHKIFFLCPLFVVLIFIQKIDAVDYSVTNTAANTPGGATSYIWNTFQQQNSPACSKTYQKYIQGYSGDVKREITGVLYHESAHIWQWNGNGKAPGGLIEGIADYVRLKAGLGPSHWVKPGQGDRWDQGYDVTAQFLSYCNSLRNGFVAQLNKKMRNGYSNQCLC
ncbi:hypothetical protein KY290_021331 [Solanum tuberosum]|uniref:NtPRp27 n=1 Tax=Solanum tuberosum TaxID=4113 RepID=A0ABQ7V3B9_SOLTU|nr:hypothetical protein KY289_020487 [Solanum tuberosum]KAH0695504.1 hypothetical protein KY285_022601 [Solanum tuberosum]KAH0757838.1 hypothetical protein KY290_021331 [Solanum tuberosum]